MHTFTLYVYITIHHPASPPCPGSYSRQFRSHRIGLTAGTWFASGFLYQINFYRYDTRNFLFLFRLIDLGILWLLCCGDSASFQGGFRRQRTSWILEDSILIRPTELGSTELGTPLNSEQIECEYRNQQFGRSQTYFISEITVIPSLLSWRSRSCDFCDLYRIIGTALLIWLLVGAIQQSEHKILWPVLKVTGSKLWEPY